MTTDKKTERQKSPPRNGRSTVPNAGRGQVESEVGGGLSHAASRGDFLKWGTVALSGMYVGPKITSFAVEKSLGHSGSPAPTPVPVPPSYVSPPAETFFPATGGAAGLTPEQRKKLEQRKR